MNGPPESADSVPWWAATRERRLLIQRCRTCGNRQHYPRARCLECRDDDLEFVESPGRGTVISFSVVYRSPDPAAFPPPYTVALVRLEEGPVLFTRLVEIDEPRCDMAVILDWWPLEDGRNLPVFTAA